MTQLRSRFQSFWRSWLLISLLSWLAAAVVGIVIYYLCQILTIIVFAPFLRGGGIGAGFAALGFGSLGGAIGGSLVFAAASSDIQKDWLDDHAVEAPQWRAIGLVLWPIILFTTFWLSVANRQSPDLRMIVQGCALGCMIVGAMRWLFMRQRRLQALGLVGVNIAACFLIVAPLFGVVQAQRASKNRRVPGEMHEKPTNFVSLGDKVVFAAGDPLQLGFDLWVTDGTMVGTIRIADLLDHEYDDVPADPPRLTRVGEYAAITMWQNLHDETKLWVSDGTTAGTVFLRSFGANERRPGPFMVIDGSSFYFFAGPFNRTELWRSDGTPEGTKQLIQIPRPADSGSEPEAVLVDGMIYFAASDDTYGTELWRSDGTREGTTIVKDINPGACSGSPSRLTAFRHQVIFTAYDQCSQSAFGIELWRSDGTPAGTAMIKDIWPGSQTSTPVQLIAVRDSVLFQADDGEHGQELWRTDGTAEGTMMVSDMVPGDGRSYVGLPTIANHSLFFIGPDAAQPCWLWQSDGTAAGTNKVALLCPQTLISAPSRLFFLAPDAQNTLMLWSSRGTAADTVAIKEMSACSFWSAGPERGFAELGQEVVFSCGLDLWRSDGTTEGTAIIRTMQSQ